MIVTLQTLIFYRESLFNALGRFLGPYYNKLYSVLGNNGNVVDDEDSEEQVFAEYDEERGVVFYPPMYLQRYAAVSDCLMDGPWKGKLEKIVDLGYHDMSFIKYLKGIPGVKSILGVDLETIPEHCTLDLIGNDCVQQKDNPMEITLFKGNAADPDYRLIGCDAVVAIEMIEHMLPHDLDRLIHTVFGFIKPWVVVFTTPNGDFNVLFKAMQKNGLRRLDHFFEWSQDQFHDWCSNIVSRYPQYTVSCKGIGSGPTGTKHLGCCSQMAVFVAKEYTKQPDLNPNSLALVSDSPDTHNISNMISSWETLDIPNETNMIEVPRNMESYSELRSEIPSSLTLTQSTPTSSKNMLCYEDKMSQCNLEDEFAKNYLMFDYEQMCFDILEPRRNMVTQKVYEIEDVYNRLNCTTAEVKKFSKATRDLMASNKVDTLIYTKEVVDQIRQYAKMLNFNKNIKNQLETDTCTWCNINWGDNAPYWNQYYNVVKSFKYPLEVKSEECEILDLIANEINQLMDTRFQEDNLLEADSLEIPIDHLMMAVGHVTDDVDKVKDLLEWNGYELKGDVVVYSRILEDCTGFKEGDISDIYSELHPNSMCDGSISVTDPNAISFRRTLDQKVCRLRSLLTADEDITEELDRVMCRLMKLALLSTKGLNSPPPPRWMQSKLLDLLTLTEKAIEKRKKQFVESYPMKTKGFGENTEVIVALEKIKDDDAAKKIVDKYKHLVDETDSSPFKNHSESTRLYKEYDCSQEVPELDIEQQEIIRDADIYENEKCTTLCHEDSKLERTQAWLEKGIDDITYSNPDEYFDNSPVNTKHIKTKIAKNCKKYNDKRPVDYKRMNSKKSLSKHLIKSNIRKTESNNSTTGLRKKITTQVSSHRRFDCYSTHKKYVTVKYSSHLVKSSKERNNIVTSVSELVIEPDIVKGNSIEGQDLNIDEHLDELKILGIGSETEIAATKESMLVEIVTPSTKEIIALRRTIGVDVDSDSVLENETLTNNFFNKDHCYVGVEDANCQSIFLYDINEPTTSKGIRHTNIDVQCGTDLDNPTIAYHPLLSSTTSLTRTPKITISQNMHNFDTNFNTSTDFGTCTNDVENNYSTTLKASKSFGIKIKDSNVNLLYNELPLINAPANSISELSKSDSRSFTCIKDFNYSQFWQKKTFVGLKIKESYPNIDFKSTFNNTNNDSNQCNVISATDEQVNESKTNVRDVQNFIEANKHDESCDAAITSYADYELCNITNTPDMSSLKLREFEEHIGKPNKEEAEENKKHTKTSENLNHEITCLESSVDIKSTESIANNYVNLNNVGGNVISVLIQKSNIDLVSNPTKESFSTLSKYNVVEKLSNGGFYLSSYKDKQAEDIMYQGQWKKNKKVIDNSKCLLAGSTKKIYTSTENGVPQRLNKSTILRENLRIKTVKNGSEKIIIEQRKAYKCCNDSNTNSNYAHNNDKEKKQKLRKNIDEGTVVKPFRNVIKVPSKFPISQPLSKNLTSPFILKNPPITAFTLESKLDKVVHNKPRKKYIPPYLKRRAYKSAKIPQVITLNSNLDTVKTFDSSSNENKENIPSTKVEDNDYDLFNILLNNQNNPKYEYIVFRNEIEADKQLKITSENVGKYCLRQHSSTSDATNCSACNVVNGRPLTINVANQRQIIAPNSYCSENFTSENLKSKKLKQIKKNTAEKKETNLNLIDDFTTLSYKIDEQEKDIYISIVDNTGISIPKDSINQISTINVINCKSCTETNLSSHQMSESESSNVINNLFSNNHNKKSSESAQTSNMVVVIEPRELITPEHHSTITKTENAEIVNVTDKDNEKDFSNIQNMQFIVKDIIEERLDFIDNLIEDSIDSKSVILNDTITLAPDDLPGSPASLNTVITNENNHAILPSDVEYALNRSFDTDISNESVADHNTGLAVSDFDMISFKSLASGSKMSGYWSADNESSSTYLFNCVNSEPRADSVQDIFERKDPLTLAQNNAAPGVLANQAFSGYTLNEEQVAGDQQDFVSLVDSETGSVAAGTTRQVASEELMVSARSSRSFGSCVLDEETVVPEWLFNVISQQQSGTSEIEAPELMVEEPMAEPLYDDNGNVVGPAGAGAGAGDGRGIHSDLSQDSSGQGTSFSSTDTSSEPQSQVILIDPSAFLTQPHMSREAIDGSFELLAIDNAETAENSIRQAPTVAITEASDADVSSLGTDGEDFNDP